MYYMILYIWCIYKYVDMYNVQSYTVVVEGRRKKTRVIHQSSQCPKVLPSLPPKSRGAVSEIWGEGWKGIHRIYSINGCSSMISPVRSHLDPT